MCVSPGYCDLSDSLCVCPTGYYGSDCSIVRLTCPNNCTNSSYGDCDSQTGNCTCKTGYTVCYIQFRFVSFCLFCFFCLFFFSLFHVLFFLFCFSYSGFLFVCIFVNVEKGTNCSQLICPGSPECNYPHGTCNRATAQCVCVNNSLTTGEYYTGYHCQNKYYVCAGKPQCSGTSHGTCNSKTGQCACKYPFNVTLASDCSVASCSNDCYYHGDHFILFSSFLLFFFFSFSFFLFFFFSFFLFFFSSFLLFSFLFLFQWFIVFLLSKGNCDPTNGVCKCLAQYNTTSDCRYLYSMF